ncbi:MAG: amino acid permease [Acidimicrobiia bacterium]|nr:amino acid permease [Acidimicrobiia bacterium]
MTLNSSLRRHLNLPAVFTVSLGAMIGSGIFVLPGLATELAGPAAIVAYFLAGLIVVPAALSMAEMASAMPMAGGTYLFIDRAMGPLMGTIAGFGVWFALVFKSAFALVGFEGYLDFFVDIPVEWVGVGLAVLLTALNSTGVRVSGRFQTIIVAAVLGVLGFIVIGGASTTDTAVFTPFAPEGVGGVLAATGLVFVSYAGVTKVASIGEEVKNPSRSLPIGMLGSIGLMLILYPALLAVVVGNVDPAQLAGDPAPMVTAAGKFSGTIGQDIVAITAILALVSMANAGLLSSSRYPFAMARNSLAPRIFERVGTKSGTPTVSVLVTGSVLVLLIATVPLVELAKLASAFQVLVFSIVNLSVIAFREANVPWYQPGFRSPFYPYVQIAGIAGVLVLFTQLGFFPLFGAIGIVVLGWIWYRLFGQSRVSHESALLDALRLRATSRLIDLTRDALSLEGRDHILVPVSDTISSNRLRNLLRLAAHLAAEDGRITVARVDRDVEGALWWRRTVFPQASDPFRVGIRQIADDLGIDVGVVRPRGSDVRGAVNDYIARHAVDLVLSYQSDVSRRRRGFAASIRWLQEHASCDVAVLHRRLIGELGHIAVMGAGSPYDVMKIDVGNRLASEPESTLAFVHVLPEDSTDPQVDAIEKYHAQLEDLCGAVTSSSVERSPEFIDAIAERGRGADLVILGASRRMTGLGPELTDNIAEAVGTPVLVVSSRNPGTPGLLRSTLERLIY